MLKVVLRSVVVQSVPAGQTGAAVGVQQVIKQASQSIGYQIVAVILTTQLVAARAGGPAVISFGLFAFNLLPLPPLDGSHLWGGQVSRAMRDVHHIEEEMAGEIAENLHISLCTVRSHMKKIHAKCGLREREKLAVTSYQSFQQELAAKMAESDSPQQLRLHPSEYAVRGLIPVCPS